MRLQAFGKRDVTLAAEHDMGVLPAGEGETEVIEAVIEAHAGDAHPGLAHVGEVGQAEPARHMKLAEDDVLVGAVDGAPGADAALERAPYSGAEFGMAPADLFEDPDRAQARRRLEHRHDLLVPDPGQRIGTAARARLGLLRGQHRIGRQAIARGGADPCLGGGDRRRVGDTQAHEHPHLTIGDVAAGQGRFLR